MTRSRQTADWGSRAGLAKIVPSSVAVGSGTGSADSLGTVTFTGASSVSLNGVFSSTYDNYVFVVNLTSVTTDNDSFIRLRTGGTDNTASVYGGAVSYMNSASSSGSASFGATQSYWTTQYMASAHTAGEFIMNIFNPYLARQTGATGHQVRHNSSSTGDVESRLGSFVHGAATSFDSLTYGRATGTATGTIQIYGYTK